MNIDRQFSLMSSSSYNQYSLFVQPYSDDQCSNQSWSPFSTPSISPYGSPPQTCFQYSIPFTRAPQLPKPIESKFTKIQLPTPIARPYNNSHFKSANVKIHLTENQKQQKHTNIEEEEQDEEEDEEVAEAE